MEDMRDPPRLATKTIENPKKARSRVYEAADEGSAQEAALASQRYDAETATENLSEMKMALEGSLVEWALEQCATCSVIVTIDHQGRIDVRRGLMRPEDRKSHVQSLKAAGQPVPASLQDADAAKGERTVHSVRLMLDLRAHRTAALQAALTRNTLVAFALVVQRLVRSRCAGAAARAVDADRRAAPESGATGGISAPLGTGSACRAADAGGVMLTPPGN